MTFKEFMEVFKFWKEVEKNPDLEIPSTTRAKEAPAGFTEADMEAAKTKAADEAAKAEREKVEAEFAEEARDAAREAREEAISEWCDDMVEKGRLTPSLVKYGVPEMLSFMAAKDDLVEFGETKDKATLYDRFKGLFETELPKLVEFNEIATRDKDVSGDDSEKREKLVSEFMERESCDYKTAVLGVSEKHPELFKGGDRS